MTILHSIRREGEWLIRRLLPVLFCSIMHYGAAGDQYLSESPPPSAYEPSSLYAFHATSMIPHLKRDRNGCGWFGVKLQTSRLCGDRRTRNTTSHATRLFGVLVVLTLFVPVYWTETRQIRESEISVRDQRVNSSLHHNFVG